MEKLYYRFIRWFIRLKIKRTNQKFKKLDELIKARYARIQDEITEDRLKPGDKVVIATKKELLRRGFEWDGTEEEYFLIEPIYGRIIRIDRGMLKSVLTTKGVTEEGVNRDYFSVLEDYREPGGEPMNSLYNHRYNRLMVERI